MNSAARNVSYSVRHVGRTGTSDSKTYIQADNTIISAFHDIPLHVKDTDLFNMIVEVPRWTNAKLEISKSEPLNPIVQDIKNGKLRFVANVFPFKGYVQTYGAFPQTWEDPEHTNPDTRCNGDNDPLDVVEIGVDVGHTGQVKQVKVLGCLAMIDDGETDWKIVTIDANDSVAANLNDIDDVDKHMPGLLDGIRTWFKNYKVPDGKPINEFAFDGQYKDRNYALKVISECHEAWKKLVSGKIDVSSHKISISRASDNVSIQQINQEITERPVDKPQQETIAYLAKL